MSKDYYSKEYKEFLKQLIDMYGDCLKNGTNATEITINTEKGDLVIDIGFNYISKE